MKIICSRKIPVKGLALLQQAGHEVTEFEEPQVITTERLIELCQGQEALLCASATLLNTAFFQACAHLKAITLLSVGHDNVDTQAANQYKIPVGNTPDVVSAATADTAFLLMLAVARKAIFHYKRITAGQWQYTEPTAFLGQDIEGKTLGIFGMGRIGMDLATKCQAAYHMPILYHNRHPNMAAEKKLAAKYVSFDELLAKSDFLSVHANLSKETKGMFNKAAFEKMKPNAIFINTARGGLHQEEDLIDALNKGTIWGAGLDVTNPEPMQANNALLQHPNACIFPHIGTATQETRDAMAVRAAGNLIAALEGKKMPYCINPEVYD